MFDKWHKSDAQTIASSSEYTNVIRPKDGHAYVMLIDSFNQAGSGHVLQIEEKYTNQVNEVLDKLQGDGYEILDVKFFSEPYTSMVTGSDLRYQTLICYC